MINQTIRLAAGILASTLIISGTPVEAMAATPAEATKYITGGTYSFSAGAHSAINEAVVLFEEDEEDDYFYADGETDVTENDAPIVADPEEELEVEEEAVEDKSEPADEYANIAITQVSAYLNVRKEPNADADVVGKLYNNCAANILEVVGDWYKIESGNVEGYISSKYVVVGDEKLCKEAAVVTGKITTNSLRLRKKASTSSGIHTILAKGNKVEILSDNVDGWYKINYKSYTGYISADYVKVSTTYNYGETREEEKERLKKEAEEERRKEEAKKDKNSSNKNSSNKVYKEPEGSGRQDVVDYALQFVGNRYKWGGESLTNGVDCSGFVMKVYEKFGIDLPHSSYDMRKVGKKVSKSDLRKGDIICYSGHVAIYIGNGRIVHASNKKDGIKITKNYKYKRVITIRRVL